MNAVHYELKSNYYLNRYAVFLDMCRSPLPNALLSLRSSSPLSNKTYIFGRIHLNKSVSFCYLKKSLCFELIWNLSSMLKFILQLCLDDFLI